MRNRTLTDRAAARGTASGMEQPGLQPRPSQPRPPVAAKMANSLRRQPPGWDIDSALDDEVPFPDEHDFWLEVGDDDRD
jgi:hypothetical protein